MRAAILAGALAAALLPSRASGGEAPWVPLDEFQALIRRAGALHETAACAPVLAAPDQATRQNQLACLKAALSARKAPGVARGEARLEPDERRALLAYIDSFAYLINKALRTGDKSYVDRHAADIRLLRRALDHLPAFEGVVFRGSDFPPAGGLGAGAFVDPAFVSTSLSFEIAEHYAGVGGYLYVILSRSGRLLSYDKSVAELAAEQEVLFKNGAAFQILEVLPQPKDRRTVVFLAENP
ncbi:MAG: hypothetical protein AAB320_06010 [Elusimicrobiota bacterium]